ncbi:MAG TPA: CDP-alcohol phosphatidyltransferase family protein [Solirubrobacteraceae bacterium]|jgi:phosphatidylglycerophosphate synthase|nr:CDP-alcohol phosphatidyltransferase family protein [Solirubrobacteraceae bacterium]
MPLSDHSRVLPRTITGEPGLIAVTILRLVLLVPLIWGISHEPAVAAGALGLIVAVDIVDGVVARGHRLDGTRRRLTDAAVDKLMIHAASLAVVLKSPDLLPIYLPLLARDVGVCSVSLWLILRYKAFVSGRPIHRLASVTYALLGAAALTGNAAATLITGAVAWFVHYAVLGDYLRGMKTALGSEHKQLVVIQTTADSPES